MSKNRYTLLYVFNDYMISLCFVTIAQQVNEIKLIIIILNIYIFALIENLCLEFKKKLFN